MATNETIAHSRAAFAPEGLPWLVAAVVLGLVFWRLDWLPAAGATAVLVVLLFLLFRDPVRVVPPLPAAIYAPVDGRVVAVEQVVGHGARSSWWLVRIRVSRLGAYTIRAPIEGSIMQVEKDSIPGPGHRGLRLRSEEGDEVLLIFPHRGPLRAPRSFVRYGERLGQGHRFAYLRLAPVAEVYLPADARLTVAAGDGVRAGATVLAELISV